MEVTELGFLAGSIAFLVSLAVFPKTLKFAKEHGIVDNPNVRKLQRVPVPVMGGIAVFSGILAAMVPIVLVTGAYKLGLIVIAMLLMLVIGMWDDIKNLSAILRLFIEIALVWSLMALNGNFIDNFHGLWGIHEISNFVSMPLSLIAGVGIINAVNLIDGVDGYSSSYGILACISFSIMFFSVGYNSLGLLAITCACAIVPFFFHNVFGRTSKMFFGDGGTLMLGTLMTVFVFSTLSGRTICASLEEKGIGLVAFAMAILAIPVFDTLRVMCARMVRGRSPFHPDKTHLHHLFIEMKFSHLGTSFFILMIQQFIILAWLVSWLAGASMDVQFYIVILLGMGTTFGFYRFMKMQQRGGEKDEDGIPQGSAIWKAMCRLGYHTHYERKGVWNFMQRLVDWNWEK